MSANTSIPDTVFTFFLSLITSISTLIPERRRGIMFSNFLTAKFLRRKGANVVRRFAQHKHGRTTTMKPGKDIVEIWLCQCPRTVLVIESDETCRFLSNPANV